jgi:PiT family inorganic phosphate transporter
VTIELIIIAVILIIAGIVAFAIGANDTTMASVVGAKVLSLKAAVSLGSILLLIGAVVLGQGVSTTIGAGMVTSPLPAHLILVISLAIIIWMVFSAYQGYPISATHSIVGSVLGIGLVAQFVWGVSIIRWDTIAIIVISWVLSPLFSYVLAFFLQKLVRKRIVSTGIGLEEVLRRERVFGVLLLVMIIIICLSRGGNDVAKAVGLLTMIFVEPGQLSLLLLLGGAGMGVGLFVLGRRVVKTVGMELTELRPSSSFASAASGAIVLLIGTLLGIPLAATHILITSLIGVGKANRTPINKSVAKKLILTSILTVPLSAMFAVVIWGLFEVAFSFLPAFIPIF